MVCARCGTVFCVDMQDDSFYLSPATVLYCSKLCKRKSGPSYVKQTRDRRVKPRRVRAQVAALRQRDGDDCYLCGLPIDFTIADFNDPMHYSRDHVVPRVLGGGKDAANTRLAHRQCNTEKGQGLPAGGERITT